MEILARDLPDHTRLLHQKTGDVVEIPPGWIHCVVNVMPCIKLAYDRIVVEDMVKFPFIHSTINVPFFRQSSAQDYQAMIMKSYRHLYTKVREWKNEHGII